VGCHDPRNTAPPVARARAAVGASLERIQPPSWGTEPFSYERVVQPVLDRFRDGLDLPWIGSAAYEKIIGESSRSFFQLEDGNFFRLLFLTGE